MLPSLLACTWVPLEDLEEKLACCDSDTAGVVDPGVVQAEGTTDLGVVFVGRSAETRLVVENLGPGDVTLDASLDPDDEWSGVLASSLQIGRAHV